MYIPPRNQMWQNTFNPKTTQPSFLPWNSQVHLSLHPRTQQTCTIWFAHVPPEGTFSSLSREKNTIYFIILTCFLYQTWHLLVINHVIYLNTPLFPKFSRNYVIYFFLPGSPSGSYFEVTFPYATFNFNPHLHPHHHPHPHPFIPNPTQKTLTLTLTLILLTLYITLLILN